MSVVLLRVSSVLAASASMMFCGPTVGAQELLVSGFTSQEVHRYSLLDGSYQGPLDTMVNPQGMVYGPDGNLYIAEEGANAVRRYDPVTLANLGDFVWDDPTTPEDETGGLDHPTGVAFGPDGRFFVASFDSDSVLSYDGTTGKYLGDFVTRRSGGLNGPDAGIVFGPDGHLYVPSYFTDQVLRYDGSTGAFLGAFVSAGAGGLSRPRTLVFRSDGLLYVSGDTSSAIHRYDRSGAVVDRFVNLARVTGFGLNPLDGNVYATSVSSNSVQRFDGTTGKRIDTFVQGGSGGLDAAVFLAFRPNLFVQLDRPSPGVAGVDNAIAVHGASPNSVVWLLLGTRGGSIRLHGCPHAYVGILDSLLLPLFTDAAGDATIHGMMDGSLSGSTFLLQVVDLRSCRISNLVEQTF